MWFSNEAAFDFRDTMNFSLFFGLPLSSSSFSVRVRHRVVPTPEFPGLVILGSDPKHSDPNSGSLNCVRDPDSQILRTQIDAALLDPSPLFDNFRRQNPVYHWRGRGLGRLAGHVMISVAASSLYYLRRH